MLDLSRKLTDELVLGDDVYPMNIAFNKVLKVVELINDDDIDELYKPFLAIQLLTRSISELFQLKIQHQC